MMVVVASEKKIRKHFEVATAVRMIFFPSNGKNAAFFKHQLRNSRLSSKQYIVQNLSSINLVTVTFLCKCLFVFSILRKLSHNSYVQILPMNQKFLSGINLQLSSKNCKHILQTTKLYTDIAKNAQERFQNKQSLCISIHSLLKDNNLSLRSDWLRELRYINLFIDFFRKTVL